MTSSATLEHLTSDEQIKKNLRDEQRARFSRALSIITIVILVAFWLWANYKTSMLPVVNTVSISDARITGETSLCPGDPLAYAYHFHATGSGVLIRDRVLWRVTPPPKTLIFSVSRRFILSDAVDQQLTEAWHLPETYLDPETDLDAPLPPGDYKLIFAISSPSRSTVVSIADVDFTVKAEADCLKD